jgi:hypothetical protein
VIPYYEQLLGSLISSVSFRITDITVCELGCGCVEPLCVVAVRAEFSCIYYVPFDLLDESKYSHSHLLIRYAQSKRALS